LYINETGCGSTTIIDDSILDTDGNGVGDCHQPQWRNQGQNRSSIIKGEAILLYAEAKSYELDWAWLSTNETGVWENKTYMDMSDATDWTWSNFTWSNSSFAGTLGWKIYHNDTSGFTNVTNLVSFEARGCVTITVVYNDDCPRSNADILTTDAPNPPYERYVCGPTNETGQCEKCDYLEPGDYLIQAWYGPSEFGPVTYLYVDENGDGSATIRDSYHSYPNGTESCGDSECDGFQYCIVPEVGNPFIECDSWDTECDTKKCCQCTGGTEANPTEDYDETQDGDCEPGYECSELDTCSLSHDTAVIDVSPFKTVVAQDYFTTLNVTVENQGGAIETANVTAFYNATAIILPDGKNYTTVTLAALTSTTIEVLWNTTGVTKGNYTLSAYATPVSGETDTGDNTCTDGKVRVTILGDVNGDRTVNIVDLTIVSLAYGRFKGEPGYNPEADITEDQLVDMRDLFIVARNLGHTDPCPYSLH